MIILSAVQEQYKFTHSLLLVSFVITTIGHSSSTLYLHLSISTFESSKAVENAAPLTSG